MNQTPTPVEHSDIIYPAQFATSEEGGVVVTFRDIPEAITQGEYFRDALEMAQDALATAMEFYFEDNRLIPKPSAFQHGDVAIALTKELAVSVQLHNVACKHE